MAACRPLCNSCHREPLWTEPGWNQHAADEMKIDSFEAVRSPGRAHQTVNHAGIFVRERGLFMRPENISQKCDFSVTSLLFRNGILCFVRFTWVEA